MMDLRFLIILVISGLFISSCVLAGAEKVCVSKVSKGKPQCSKKLEKAEPINNVQSDQSASDEQNKKCDSLKACGIQIYKKNSMNLSVCMACGCPSWAREDFYIIGKNDLAEALEIGFKEAPIDMCKKKWD